MRQAENLKEDMFSGKVLASKSYLCIYINCMYSVREHSVFCASTDRNVTF